MNKSKLFKTAHAMARALGPENGHYQVRLSYALKYIYAPTTKDIRVKVVGYIDIDAVESREKEVASIRADEKEKSIIKKIWKDSTKALKEYNAMIQSKRDKVLRLRKETKAKAYHKSHNQLANKLSNLLNK